MCWWRTSTSARRRWAPATWAGGRRRPTSPIWRPWAASAPWASPWPWWPRVTPLGLGGGAYGGMAELLGAHGGVLLGGDCSGGRQRLLAVTALGRLPAGAVRSAAGTAGRAMRWSAPAPMGSAAWAWPCCRARRCRPWRRPAGSGRSVPTAGPCPGLMRWQPWAPAVLRPWTGGWPAATAVTAWRPRPPAWPWPAAARPCCPGAICPWRRSLPAGPRRRTGASGAGRISSWCWP